MVTVFFSLFFPLVTFSAESISCFGPVSPGEICIVDLNFVRPTQGAVGELEVNYKRSNYREVIHEALDSRDPEAAYEDFLQGKKRKLEIVLGPSKNRRGGKPVLYIIDRHHTSRAMFLEFENLSLAQRKKLGGFPKAYAHVVADLSHLDQEEFEKVMERPQKYYRDHPKYFSEDWAPHKRTSWVRLKDAKGEKMSGWDKLPQHIDEIPDDPFRSAAWLLGESEAFKKTNEPFVEFYVADQLRKDFDRKFIRKLLEKDPDEAAALLGKWSRKNLGVGETYLVEVGNPDKMEKNCKANFSKLVKKALESAE